MKKNCRKCGKEMEISIYRLSQKDCNDCATKRKFKGSPKNLPKSVK